MRFVRLNHKTKKSFKVCKFKRNTKTVNLLSQRDQQKRIMTWATIVFSASMCIYVFIHSHSTHCTCPLNFSSIFNLPVHQLFFCCDYAAFSLFSIQTPLLKLLKIISTKPDFGVHLLALNITSPLGISLKTMVDDNGQTGLCKMLYYMSLDECKMEYRRDSQVYYL